MHPSGSNPTDQFRELLRRLVFVGFNSRVAALERETGAVVWN